LCCSSVGYRLLVCQGARTHLGPHSFPTRRSSDLLQTQALAVVPGHADQVVAAVPLHQLGADLGRTQGAITAAHFALLQALRARADRKSTRLNSSHVKISYAVFCLKKKTDIRVTRP